MEQPSDTALEVLPDGHHADGHHDALMACISFRRGSTFSRQASLRMEPLETGSLLQRVLFCGVMLITVFVPLSAVVRAVAAFYSPRIRNSIAQHKLVHVVWFIGAIIIAFFLLAPLVFTAKTKSL
jgi:hypothetical protein